MSTSKRGIKNSYKMGILKSLVRAKIKRPLRPAVFCQSITKMERWAEAASDQMEESSVMECAGLYNENDPWSGAALLRMIWTE